MKKILYIHGFSSSGTSKTTKSLQKLLDDADITAPDLPPSPFEALNLLDGLCKELKPDMIIGTSVGGMFAQLLRGYKKILINPAFHVYEFLKTKIGIHPYLNPRINGEKEFEVTSGLCMDYLMIENTQFESISEGDRKYTYALFGEKDDVVNCRKEYCKYYKYYKMFPGEHRMTYRDIKDYLIPYIKEILY